MVKNNKKAQIQSQVFVYIFAMVVIALILYFGIRSIMDFHDDTENVGVVTFQTDLSSIITSVASEYGSIRKVDLVLPREYKEVCFADDDTNPNDMEVKEHPLIHDALADGTTDNVFLIKDFLEKQFRTADLDVITSNNFLCVKNTKGHVIFNLKGKARYAEIYP